MTAVPALIRARHPQMLIELLAELHPEVHARVIPTLSCAEKLTHALPVEWIPIEMDVELIDAVSAALSPATLAALVSERQRREMGSALFRTFVATMQKLFGLSPTTILRHLGRGWRQVFSECGEIDLVSLGDGQGVALLRGLPDVCLRSSAWIGVLPAGMRVLFEFVNTRGEVTSQRRGGDIELRFRW